MKRRKDLNSGKIWADEISCFNELESESRVYLGAGRDANNLDRLVEKKIKNILNVADDVPNFHEDSSKIEIVYKNLMVGDFGTEKEIRRVFNPAKEFVEGVLARKENCLIHCANGSNRSATVAIALAMDMMKYSLLEAWTHVASCHSQSLPLKDNREKLLEFEYELYSENTMKEGRGTLVAIEEKE